MIIPGTTPKFELGIVVATPAAIEAHGMEAINACLQRHLAGDWGDLPAADALLNDGGVNPDNPDRLHSSYKLPTGKLWIISEWDRSATTALLPSDY